MNIISLDLLKKGQKAIISEVLIDKIPLKLIEMGCMEGYEVTMIQKAPLGDPIYYKINDAHLAIRKDIAKDILISLISN